MLSSLFSSTEAHTYVYNMCLLFTSICFRESVEQVFPLKRIHSTQDQQDQLAHQRNNWQSATFTLSYKKVLRRDMEVFFASQNKQVPSKEEQQHISSSIPSLWNTPNMLVRSDCFGKSMGRSDTVGQFHWPSIKHELSSEMRAGSLSSSLHGNYSMGELRVWFI